jgi:hypothetical protein
MIKAGTDTQNAQSCGCHRVGGVGDQIQRYLLQLNSVALCQRERLPAREGRPNAGDDVGPRPPRAIAFVFDLDRQNA